MFKYTYEFLTKVRSHKAESLLNQKGWAKDVTSTIVKCRKCGCNYIRDVVPLSKERTPYKKERFMETQLKLDTFRKYKLRDDLNWIVRNLIVLASKNNKRDIKFLDFGSGGATACNFARAYGIRDVVAYDPNYIGDFEENLNLINYPGIVYINSKNKLLEFGEFDVVIFKSAIEHVLDPRHELAIVYKIMSKGAYLYINNPIMDLDREIHELTEANKIIKKDKLSYYHPGHLNYMKPKMFSRMIRETGFEIKPMVFIYPPVPFERDNIKSYLISKIKHSIRYVQTIFGIMKSRYVFIVQKP